MKVKRFIGPNMQQALRIVSRELGDDAVILSTKKVAEGFEVVAALDYQSDNQKSPSEVNRQLELQKELERARALQKDRQQAIARGETPAPVDLERDIRFDSGHRNAAMSPLAGYERPAVDIAAEPASIPTSKPASAARSDMANGMSAGVAAGMTSGAGIDSEAYGDMLERMKGELSDLKNWMVSHGGSAWDTGRPMTWQQSQLWQRCQDMGLEPVWSDRIVTSIEDHENLEQGWKQVLQQMASDVPIAKAGSLDKGGIFALVGPTGAGKTTTIGKLAARFVIHHGADSVALVSMDSYRVAAQDQLRSVARILGVQLHTAAPGDDLLAMVEQLYSKERKKLVLVDTAGLASQDPSFPVQLSMLKKACNRQGKGPRLRCLLTLPLTSQGRCLQENYEHYKDAGLAGCIFTKLDECFSLGPAMSIAALTRTPVVMVADGPHIPDDLHYPDAGKLVKLSEQMARMARTRWQATVSGRFGQQSGSQHGVQ
ncbi:flagellar biosynthesis protein FlhF [Oceanobacter kriegii]|uniref:flagellar biosynthesis protein FlhF n=1 Tax=Oceanobacter kriegii TaxID=64972 RepID=UPI000410D04D|nr:flagellar biosynthesis protein FlhF [Oceanobacter kriegii]